MSGARTTYSGGLAHRRRQRAMLLRFAQGSRCPEGFGYLTALARTDLCGDFEYVHRNKIEKWFQTLKMWVKRFHNTWTGSAALAALPSSITIISSDQIRRSTIACPSKRC